ncbi:porin [Pseudomonas sp. zfem002]|uniref:porin n=1 Tax=Pseudomonas sp. zfem002 TaxID=3078197 RepID=UPI00292753DA|nr:porin [Pseudomonas sp. zfem002]MDU9391301.1 porin [Pseudomonas sp. zfem002]
MQGIRTLGLASLIVSAPAIALEQGEHRFNGFGTAGFTYLGGEDAGRRYGINGQTTDSWRGDQLSKLGAQLQYGLTDTLGVTVQATAKPERDTWKGNLEWAYLSWAASDRLTLRAGRLRLPVYMHSETLDVGFTHPWVRLPDEVYSQVQLSNYEGGDLLYSLPIGIGSLTFQVAGGQAVNRNVFSLDGLYDIDYKKVFAANVTLETSDFGALRVGYAEADIDTDITRSVIVPGGVPASVGFKRLDQQKSKFTSIGYQYDNGTWISSNEWTSNNSEADQEGSIDAFYLMGGRRFGDVLLHLTYAQLDEDRGRQSSWTYGVNYNLTPSVILKGEYKRVDTRGTGYRGVFVESAQETFDHALYAASNGAAGVPARNYDGDILSVGIDFVF